MEFQLLTIVAAMAIGFAIIYALLRSAFNQSLLKLHEKSEEKSTKHKSDTESGVKELLSSNKDQIDLIVREIKSQLKDSRSEVQNLKQQNSALQKQLTQAVEVTQSLQTSTEGLRSLLSNNRLRGEWGEQVAEELLMGAGFVEGQQYTKQTTTQEGRPDFTIMLPDGTSLNVDAKFPFDDLVAYQESEGGEEKKQALKRFETAVKNKIREVTSKDYINPEAQTLDFVVMFIPNEMIFSFIYDKLPHLNQHATDKNVVMIGPFGFTALLRMVLQAHRNFRYEKGLQEILGLIEKFRSEYEKFGTSFEKLGNQLETTRKTFAQIETTRHNQLTRVVDKISEHTEQHQLVDEADDVVKLDERKEE